jgi:transposase
VVSKYADHVPLYRQSAILERESGIELSRATLDGWVMRVGELLRPLTGALGQELLKGDYIQADETSRPNARWARKKSSGLSLAIQPAGGSGGL